MADSKKRSLLDSDGELSTDFGAESQTEVVYCNECGTPNTGSAAFCRKCGHRLDEQEAEMVGVKARSGTSLGKSKNDALLEGPASRLDKIGAQVAAAGDTLIQLATYAGVAGMVITGLVVKQGLAAVLILGALVGLEAIRSGKQKRLGGVNALTNLFIIAMVCGIGITALVMNQGLAAVLIMGLWVALEAVRN